MQEQERAPFFPGPSSLTRGRGGWDDAQLQTDFASSLFSRDADSSNRAV